MVLMIPLKGGGGTPLNEQIYEYNKQETRAGGLRAAVLLPSTRQLAENLKVSRSTTQLAYDQLLAEGYIESRPCRGYFVCEAENLLEISPARGKRERGRGRQLPRNRGEKTGPGPWISCPGALTWTASPTASGGRYPGM